MEVVDGFLEEVVRLVVVELVKGFCTVVDIGEVVALIVRFVAWVVTEGHCAHC